MLSQRCSHPLCQTPSFASNTIAMANNHLHGTGGNDGSKNSRPIQPPEGAEGDSSNSSTSTGPLAANPNGIQATSSSLSVGINTANCPYKAIWGKIEVAEAMEEEAGGGSQGMPCVDKVIMTNEKGSNDVGKQEEHTLAKHGRDEFQSLYDQNQMLMDAEATGPEDALPCSPNDNGM